MLGEAVRIATEQGIWQLQCDFAKCAHRHTCNLAAPTTWAPLPVILTSSAIV